jgi:hypothetical protein
MNGANIKDYVTLFFEDSGAVAGDKIFTWSIPVSYYSNQRSRVCSVSIVSANISTRGQYKTAISIDYVNGGFNSYSTSNQRHIIGHAGVVDYTQKIYETLQGYEAIRLLTNARPDKIQLRFLNYDNLELSTSDILGFIITLAFTYYDAEETDKQLHNQYTNVLR